MIRALAAALLLVSVLRAESGPSDAAVGFLIDVARDRVDLDRNTALAGNTTVEKRRAIREELSGMSEDLRQGDLRAVREKIDGDLAGVIVSQIIDFDPDRVKVHAVALRRRDGRWLAAPVPASFENTGLTYIPDLARRARDIENWLLIERTGETARLRDNVLADLLGDIRKTATREELVEGPPEKIALSFIDACRSRNLPAALACLGGLEDPLPANWKDTLRLTASGFRDPADAPGDWERLRSEGSLRAVLSTEADDTGASVRIGEIDAVSNPTGEPTLAVLDFALERSAGGLWRLVLPLWLLEEPPEDFATSEPEPERANAVLEKVLAGLPPRAFAEPAKLADSFRDALAGNDFGSVLAHLARPPNEPFALVARAARLWNGFHANRSVLPMWLDLWTGAEDGLLLITDFDARGPGIDPVFTQRIQLVRQSDGWRIAPDILARAAERSEDPELAAWCREALALSGTDWLKRIGLHAEIDAIDVDTAPAEDEARAVVNAWLAACDSHNPRAALATGAAFGDKSGPGKLFKAIGNGILVESEPEVLAIHRRGRWAGVSVRHDTLRPGTRPFDLLYPVVTTAKGPRVLGEAILESATTRTRQALNEAVWNRLEKRLPGDAVDELREISERHAELSESR